MFDKKLKLVHKLIIPPIIAFTIGVLYVALVIVKIHMLQEEINSLEKNLIPALSKATSNNTQLKNISEKFVFAILSSEIDMLPTDKEVNTITYNLNSIITNKMLHLSSYQTSLKTFNQYFSLAEKHAHHLIENSTYTTNSEEATRLIHLSNKVKNDFSNIHKNLKKTIMLETKNINDISSQIIYFSISFMLLFSFLLFMISYFIYNDFNKKFKTLQAELYALDVISKEDKKMNLSLDELSKLSIGITNKIQEFENLKDKNTQIELIANKDPLTDLFNRRYIQVLQKNIQNSKFTFGIIMLDIDFFKKINDTYGHNTGDNVLIQFAQILKNETRGDDTVVRYGGEEFLIILQNIPKEFLLTKAEQIRKKIEATHFASVGKITASLGVALSTIEDDIYRIINHADTALYRAKNNGRNNTQLYSK